MQRVVKTKTFVFEAPISEEIVARLSQWGRVASSGALTVFTIDAGEVTTKVIREDARGKVRRIYVRPPCGCLLVLDEVRDFEHDTLYYRFVRYDPCAQHK
ncbi:MAG: hypothetical protein RXQ56_07910 [Thermoproteus sp.]|jgi:hypothetical protein|uniref:hypothetical protein n=1 Tax=Thermoproteus sp. CP80 TaxID=1650659 RepID=UPI00074A1D7E|nr:hypothetical protein [Thermoproteus sp. CP80]KUO85468.1 MAG: hypothetical protein AT711_00120 [Thermoproteus sp. CIS_19]MDT7869898.1 hypothetical protein [Thermoproteus sp.]MDT7882096.1 hypothetical protein [Thermoproteus sp.]PLC66938.1 hypothetical protein B7L68_01790 [Thermoproteus sp. CP80]